MAKKRRRKGSTRRKGTRRRKKNGSGLTKELTHAISAIRRAKTAIKKK